MLAMRGIGDDGSEMSADDEIDAAFRRGKTGGGWWIAASVAAFVAGMASGEPALGLVGFASGLVLFVVGLWARRRRWRRIRDEVGDEALQRAAWRYADAERDRTAGVGNIVLWLLLGAGVLLYRLTR